MKQIEINEAETEEVGNEGIEISSDVIGVIAGVAVSEVEGVAGMLKSYIHQSKALIPAYTHLHKGEPERVKKLANVFTEDMHFLTWGHNRDKKNPETAQKFVVYRFRDGEKVDLRNADNILSVTPENFFVLPYEGGNRRYTYVITSLDAFGNESKERKIKVRL